MEITILIAVLLLVLIYLHIKCDPLIYQKNIKIAGILTVTALIMQALSVCVKFVFILFAHVPDNAESVLFFASLYVIAIWILVIIAYFNIFYACRCAAFFKITESKDPLLRNKVRDILLQACENKKLTPELKMFLSVKHNDPLVDNIRSRCGNIKYFENQLVPLKEWEKLREYSEELNE